MNSRLPAIENALQNIQAACEKRLSKLYPAGIPEDIDSRYQQELSYLKKSPLIRNMCCEKNPMANAIGYELLASRKLKRIAEQRQFTNSPFLRTVSGGNSGENF